MRAQGKRFATTKRETRNAYLKRSPRTACPSWLQPWGGMKRRRARLIAADGGNIEEHAHQ